MFPPPPPCGMTGKNKANFLEQSIRFLCVRDYELTDFTRVVIMVEDAS